MEAYQLLGQQAVLKIANVVDPQYSVACAIDNSCFTNLSSILRSTSAMLMVCEN
jgi:hypothetical protein